MTEPMTDPILEDQLPPHSQPTAANAATAGPPATIIPGTSVFVRSR